MKTMLASARVQASETGKNVYNYNAIVRCFVCVEYLSCAVLEQGQATEISQTGTKHKILHIVETTQTPNALQSQIFDILHCIVVSYI